MADLVSFLLVFTLLFAEQAEKAAFIPRRAGLGKIGWKKGPTERVAMGRLNREGGASGGMGGGAKKGRFVVISAGRSGTRGSACKCSVGRGRSCGEVGGGCHMRQTGSAV